MVSQVDIVFLVSFNVGLYFVGTWYILEYISWYPLWFLAISNFSWSILTFSIVLDNQHLKNCGFLVKFVLRVSCYLECKFICPCIWFYFLSKLDYFLSSILLPPHVSLCCSFVYYLINLSFLSLLFFIVLLLLLLFF